MRLVGWGCKILDVRGRERVTILAGDELLRVFGISTQNSIERVCCRIRWGCLRTTCCSATATHARPAASRPQLLSLSDTEWGHLIKYASTTAVFHPGTTSRQPDIERNWLNCTNIRRDINGRAIANCIRMSALRSIITTSRSNLASRSHYLSANGDPRGMSLLVSGTQELCVSSRTIPR